MARVPLGQARTLMRPAALLYFYRRRLRVHAVQELLAGVGVAASVALVFATMVASASISGSAGEVVHAVVGPADLQVHSRASEGFDERTLAQVERLPGVKQAAPLLEQTATVLAPDGRRVTVDLAGANTSLVILDGLAHTLPRATLTAGGIGLSTATADELGLGHVPVDRLAPVTLQLRGRSFKLRVSAVLGPETFGALSQATVAVMPLRSLQELAGLPGRITRVLVRTGPGQRAAVRSRLQAIADGRLQVAPADEDVGLLRQALRPSDQASGFFAAISGLLGVLFAFNALLLTVPERRRAIADMRLIGTKRTAIAQLFVFQALCLGVFASLAGLLGGYALSRGVFHQSTRYLAEAFTLGTRTVVTSQPLLIAFAAGVIATCLASLVPLLDLRRTQAVDAVYRDAGVPGNALPAPLRRALAFAATALLAASSALFALDVSRALLASMLLALATVLTVPLAFVLVLRCAHLLAERRQRLTVLTVALSSLRSTTLRSLALAATGAIALFGSIALGGARDDLLHGIERFARAYSADAPVWVGSSGDNQAVVEFRPPSVARIARLPGVRDVSSFQGGFLEIGRRRVWVIARPPGAARNVLESQISGGLPGKAATRLSEGGWVVVSKQIAEQAHVAPGGMLPLPTPSGEVPMRVAATTTNMAWSPGTVLLGTDDFRRLWRSSLPTALAVRPDGQTSPRTLAGEIRRALGPDSGLEVVTARERQRRIDSLTGEGLSQLREISSLLLLAAIVAMAAALTSAIWQRRTSLAGLRLSGVKPARLRLILLVESALMLSAGCVTGALAGVYGQLIIDGYLTHVTGFPVASLGANLRPPEIFAIVLAVVLAIVTVPGWLASRVPPTLAFNE